MTVNKYFNRISVSSASFAAVSAPDVSLGFQGSISLVNEGTGTIEYSFDGVTLNGDMVPGTGSAQIVFENPGLNLIWFRLKSGATSSVRVEGAEGGLTVGSSTASTVSGSTNATIVAPLGSRVSAQAVSVVVASDQAGFPVNIKDSQGLNIKISQQTMANSVPVVIASNQTSFPVTIAAGSATIGAVTGTAAAGASASGNPVQVGGVYNSSAPTASTGQIEPLQLDVNGNIKEVEQYAPAYEDNADAVAMMQTRAIATNTGAWSLTSSASSGAGTSGVLIKSSAGRVRSIRVSNTNATTGFWLQLFNKASAAVNNDVPVDRIFVPSQTIAGAGGAGTQYMDWGIDGLYLGTGISIAASTTAGLLTLLAATDCLYSIRFI